MLKQILVFRNLLWLQPFLVRGTHFLSVETTIFLFFKYYSVEIMLEQRYFIKKGVIYELRGLFT